MRRQDFKTTPSDYAQMMMHHDLRLIQEEISAFKSYTLLMGEHIRKEQDSLKKFLENMMEEDRDQGEYGEFDPYDHYSEEINMHYGYFPSVLYQSTFQAIFSFFEKSLKKHCSRVRIGTEAKLKVKDLRSNGYFDDFKTYLNVVLGLDLLEGDLRESWDRMKRYAGVRNTLVHGGTVLPEDGRRIAAIQSFSERGIEVNEEMKTFKISGDQFLLDFCNFVGSYLVQIIEQSRRILYEKSGS